jgi:ribonuclease HI
VKGWPGAKYKKLTNAADAEEWCRSNGGLVTIVAPHTEPVKTTSTCHTTPYERPAAAPSGNKSTSERASRRTVSTRNDREIEDESGWDVVFCDGACKGNGQKGSYAGIGVWWGHADPR